MVAQSKLSRVGLGAVLVVLATALGGCAESVGSEPAGAPTASDHMGWTGPAEARHTRFVAPRVDSGEVLAQSKSAGLVTHGAMKRANLTTGINQ
jgi:hypothetical protein